MSHQSHLFTIRLWLEELGSSRSEWRGQVQLVANSETRYFRNWEALVAHLNAMLAEVAEAGAAIEALIDENLAEE